GRWTVVTRTLPVLFLLGNLAYAAGPSWVRAIGSGGSGSDVGNAVKTDQFGNQYVTGSFSSGAQFGSQTLSSQGGSDIFLAKYGSGGKLLWIVQAGGIWDDIGFDVALGSAGNVYVTGKVIESATFQSLNGPSKTVSGINEIIFLAKYSPTGTLLWLQTGMPLGGSNDGFCVAVQPGTGAVFLTGRASSSQVTFSSADGTQHMILGSPPWHMYLVKYDQAGNFQWGEWNEPNPNDVGFNSIGHKVAVD